MANPTVQRLLGHVRLLEAHYPGVWTELARQRQLAQSGAMTWPDWCWLPMAAAAEVVLSRHGMARGPSALLADPRWPQAQLDLAGVAAVGAWRHGAGIYRLSPAMAAAATVVEPDAPLRPEVLYRLPEWGVYLEYPTYPDAAPAPLLGAYAHLEWDYGREIPELRLVLEELDGRLVAYAVLLDQPTLAAGLDAYHRSRAGGTLAALGIANRTARELLLRHTQTLISLLLLVCGVGAVVVDPDDPAARPQRRERSPRLLPAPRVWEVRPLPDTVDRLPS